jgi:hypothetical protein
VSSSGRSLVLEFADSVSASEVSCAESELSNEESESSFALVGIVVGGARFHLRRMV